MDSMYRKIKGAVFPRAGDRLQDCVGLAVTQQNHFFCKCKRIPLMITGKIMSVRVLSSGGVQTRALIQVAKKHTEFGLAA